MYKYKFVNGKWVEDTAAGRQDVQKHYLEVAMTPAEIAAECAPAGPGEKPADVQRSQVISRTPQCETKEYYDVVAYWKHTWILSEDGTTWVLNEGNRHDIYTDREVVEMTDAKFAVECGTTEPTEEPTEQPTDKPSEPGKPPIKPCDPKPEPELPVTGAETGMIAAFAALLMAGGVAAIARKKRFEA